MAAEFIVRAPALKSRGNVYCIGRRIGLLAGGCTVLQGSVTIAVREEGSDGQVQTIPRQARFVYSPYTAAEMQGFAGAADSIRARIQNGQNIYDQASARLKPGLPGRRGYPDYKAAQGPNPVRRWTWSGHRLRYLKVLTANENRAAIGFLDESLPGRRLTASQIAAFNNRREAQWGVSPHDRQAVLAPFKARPFVMLKAA